jgi:MFS family permease
MPGKFDVVGQERAAGRGRFMRKQEEWATAGAIHEWKANWKVVLAAACGLAFTTMPSYTMGVFMGPLEREFGWSRAETSSVLMAFAALAVVLGPFVGFAVDRFGPRRIGIAGALLVCATIALLSTATGSLVSWWALWVAVSIACLLTKATVWVSGVSSFFSAGRGLALAVTLCGSSLGSAMVPIVANYFIEHHGWRMAYVGLGVFFALIVAPPIFLFFTSAQDRARTKRGREFAEPSVSLSGLSAREGLRSLRFIKLTAAGFTTTFCASAFAINLVPILISNGQSSTGAASIAGLLGLASIVGRLCTGVLLDRFNGNLVAAFFAVAPVTASILLLIAPGSTPVTIAAVLILGTSLGAELDCVAYLTTRHFGLRSFGVIFATMGGIMAMAYGLGPVLMSYSFDVTRSYDIALLAVVPISVISGLLYLSLGPYLALDGPDPHIEKEACA